MNAKDSTRDWIRQLAVLAATAILFSCDLQAEKRCPPPETIAADVGEPGLPPVTRDTLDLSAFDLVELDLHACLATVHGRVPPYSLLYLSQHGPVWTLSLKDGAPSLNGERLVLEAVRRSAPGADERNLAKEITRALIDSDASAAVVLESQDSIPVDRVGSDVLRDLVAQGLDKERIGRLLLEGAPAAIHAPRFQLDSESRRWLVYYVWRYYGGTILRVQVPLESATNSNIGIEAVAARVGSWDFRM